MNSTNTEQKNLERDTADAALAVQKIITKHAHIMHVLPLLISELIAEVYRLDSCSELLHQWHLNLSDF